ncbi:glutamate receptor ionotropic, delta-2-like [Oratosquilla oratoria]|uniref:glutamate receptor ionotropic, delta-2-like n=1 Tax=Oratosquilla oratoria TaxID=337810 RepID=UPI003F761E43
MFQMKWAIVLVFVSCHEAIVSAFLGLKPQEVTVPDVTASELLAILAKGRLSGCHQVLLTQARAPDNLEAIAKLMTEKTKRPLIAYDVMSFTTEASPGTVTGRPTPHIDFEYNIYCVAYFVIAEKIFLKEALRVIPRSDWFPGAKRYFVSYCGESFNVQEILEDQVFAKSYNTLYLSPAFGPNGTRHHEATFHLLSNCPFCSGGEPEVLVRSRWSPRRGFQNPKTELFPDLFRDCNGHVFRAVTLDFPPFMHYRHGSSTTPVTKLDCLDVRIMDSIARHLNFSYNVYEPVDGKWGYQLPNGSWTGVIGTIERYEADFSMDISITADRDYYVDFTIGYHTEPLTFVTSKPQPLPQWLSLVRPYQLYVWVCFLGALALAGPCYWLLLRAAPEETKDSKNHTIVTASFIIFATLITQSQRWPRASSARLYAALWVLFSLVATTSYVGNLTAFLTVPALSPTVDSLEELSRSTFVWGIASYGAADYQLFRSSKVPLYQKIFKSLDMCPSVEDCIQRTLDERYAYISWRTYLRDAIATSFTDRNGDSRVYMAKEDFFPGEFGFTVQKGSPLKRPFDGVIRRLLEGGFVAKWLSEIIEQHTLETRRREEVGLCVSLVVCLCVRGLGLTLTVHHLQGIFFVYVVGVILALLTLFHCQYVIIFNKYIYHVRDSSLSSSSFFVEKMHQQIKA